MGCENHEALTRRCAATDARMEGMENWVGKLEDKIDELQRTLNDINLAISRAYGMVRLAVWLAGLAASGVALAKFMKG